MSQKKYILFNPGPVHHFFFIPITLIWNLLKNNELILILDESYKDNLLFSKIEELPGIKDIIFIQERNSIQNYTKLKKILSKILSDYNFSEIYIHNPSYVSSYALALLSKKLQPSAKRTYFQVAREVNSYPKEAEIKLNILIENFKYKFLPYFFIKNIIKFKVNFKFIIVFKFLPLLTFGDTFAPWSNPYYPKKSYIKSFIRKGFCLGNQDQTIFYDKKVIDYMHDFFYDAKFNLSKVSLESYHNEIYSYFFEDSPSIRPTISIFPTWGVFKENLDEDWLKIIQQLRKSYPNHRIQIKFHPGVQDKYIEEIFIKISKKVSDIKILSRNTPAFKMLIDSSIIIGDTTTVLWFATFYKNKKVFSLDVFNFFDGDCLKLYSDKLYYINDISKLSLINDS
ncbi:MAG: hypothetical protein CMA43_00885 [Euryarchaeota archaeon]|nr:hypothetical protein [Euryarchaeota archaeon]|tara:strand:- start:3148 stop:4335 length:1188 start_codon:yes stop_codon:yes gene_type:complete